MIFLKHTLPLLFLSLTFTISAQRPVDHVPSTVSMAFGFHPGHLNEKVNIREFQQMAFYQMLVDQFVGMAPAEDRDQVKQALTDLTSIGINDLADVYVFSQMTEEITYYGMVLGLADAAKFEAFFNSMMPEGMQTEQLEGYRFIQPESSVAMGWTSKTLVIGGADVKTNWYDYPEEVPYEEWEEWEETEEMEWPAEEMPAEELTDEKIDEIVEEVWAEEMPAEELTDETIDEIIEDVWEEEDDYYMEDNSYDDYYAEIQQRENEETANWTQSLLSRDFGATISANASYTNVVKGGSDMNFWMNYSDLPHLGGMGGGYGDMGMVTSMLTGLYDGMFVNMGMNFDPGQVNMDMDIYGNDKMLDIWKGTYNSKYNKKLVKYIDASELLGYMHLNLNVENLMEGYKDMFLPMLEEFPYYGETASAGLSVLGIIVDEKALYELFTGDAILAFTGMSEFTKTITTYEYDDNFNPTEVEKEMTEYFPEFSLMVGYGNEANILKLVRLLQTTGIMQDMGNYFSIQIPDVPGEFYLAMENDILFFTNDTELVSSRLETGFPKERQLTKTQVKSMKKSATNLFWDIPNTISLVSASGLPMRGAPGEFLNMGKQEFRSLSFTSSKKVKDSSKMHMTLQLTDKETNSMEQIMELINSMVMDMMGGDSRS
ncbi:MAG: DUF4836 family protein [Saprospiraceae bacterium]|nr:DUF4836 family protein [Saprospiraceae bacterium]